MRFKANSFLTATIFCLTALNTGCSTTPTSATIPATATSNATNSVKSPEPNDGTPLIFRSLNVTGENGSSAQATRKRRGAMIGSTAGQIAGVLAQTAGVIPGGSIVGIVAGTMISAAGSAAGSAIGGSMGDSKSQQNVTVDVCRPLQAPSSSGPNINDFPMDQCALHFLKIKNNSTLAQLKTGDKIAFVKGVDGQPTVVKWNWVYKNTN